MCHANNKWKETNNGRNRAIKLRNNQNAQGKGKLYSEILIEDSIKQANMKEKKEKSISDERESFTKTKSAVGIISNG